MYIDLPKSLVPVCLGFILASRQPSPYLIEFSSGRYKQWEWTPKNNSNDPEYISTEIRLRSLLVERWTSGNNFRFLLVWCVVCWRERSWSHTVHGLDKQS